MYTFKRGFTLIELLVVIAIIGILASVVLVSLNSARGKGQVSAIKANIDSIRTQAEVVYDSTNSYATVCANGNVVAALAQVSGNNGGTAATCTNSAAGWAVSATLPSSVGGYWCADSTGVAKGTQGTGTTAYTAQTGAGTAGTTDATDITCN